MSDNGQMTITEFLEARIAEDEALARGALGLHWDGSAYQQVRTVSDDDPHYYKVASGQVGLEHWEPRERLDPGTTFKHIARHDPARVLAECAAKRAILDLHPTRIYTDEEPGFSMILWDCMCDRQTLKPCPTIAALASVYDAHQDYRPEWA